MGVCLLLGNGGWLCVGFAMEYFSPKAVSWIISFCSISMDSCGRNFDRWNSRLNSEQITRPSSPSVANCL